MKDRAIREMKYVVELRATCDDFALDTDRLVWITLAFADQIETKLLLTPRTKEFDVGVIEKPRVGFSVAL